MIRPHVVLWSLAASGFLAGAMALIFVFLVAEAGHAQMDLIQDLQHQLNQLRNTNAGPVPRPGG